MIFDLHGEPFDGRVEARPFGNGPAFENAVEFEPKVVMQVAGGCFLNDEEMPGTVGSAPVGSGVRSK